MKNINYSLYDSDCNLVQIGRIYKVNSAFAIAMGIEFDNMMTVVSVENSNFRDNLWTVGVLHNTEHKYFYFQSHELINIESIASGN